MTRRFLWAKLISLCYHISHSEWQCFLSLESLKKLLHTACVMHCHGVLGVAFNISGITFPLIYFLSEWQCLLPLDSSSTSYVALNCQVDHNLHKYKRHWSWCVPPCVNGGNHSNPLIIFSDSSEMTINGGLSYLF